MLGETHPARGLIAGLAIKHAHGEPLEAVSELIISSGGIEGNAPQGLRRRITLLSLEQWREVQEELNQPLLWTMRRANILVQGIDLPATIGRQLRINDVILQVNGETDPCDIMDRNCPGLQAALRPECRGGVYASVVVGGRISLGDSVTVSER